MSLKIGPILIAVLAKCGLAGDECALSALCDKQKIALWLRGGRVFNRMMPSRQNLDEPFPSAERREKQYVSQYFGS